MIVAWKNNKKNRLNTWKEDLKDLHSVAMHKKSFVTCKTYKQ